MAVTRTPAPWRRPAPAPSNSPAARGTAMPGAIAGNSPVMTAPRVTSAGKNIPLAKAGRHDRSAPPAPGPPARRGSRGRGCVPRGVALAMARLVFACRRHQPATGTGRDGPGRSAARPADPLRRWHRIRAGLRIAESRPPGQLWVRGPPRAVLVPGRQRAVPGTGSQPGLPRCRAGEGGACRAVNMAHTTFPASPGVVQPHRSLNAQIICSPRPASASEPGVRGTGTAVPGSATAHSTQGPCCSRPSRTGRRGSGIAGPRQGVPQRVGHHLRHHDRDVLAAVCRAPPAQGGEGEVPRSTDRPGLCAERARGDPRRAGPVCPGGIRR